MLVTLYAIRNILYAVYPCLTSFKFQCLLDKTYIVYCDVKSRVHEYMSYKHDSSILVYTYVKEYNSL